MKKTELKEIKNMEIKKLANRLKNAKVDLARLFMARAEGSKGSKDVKGVHKKRKDIAQMMTILRQREMLREIESRKEEAI